MSLVEHARRELELIGEEPETIDWMCRVVEEFASFGHSGGSASILIPRLNTLLLQKNLSPLTNDPNEWIDRSEMSNAIIFQNIRNGEAFSEDGGKTYYLLSDRETHENVLPIYRSEEKK